MYSPHIYIYKVVYVMSAMHEIKYELINDKKRRKSKLQQQQKRNRKQQTIQTNAKEISSISSKKKPSFLFFPIYFQVKMPLAEESRGKNKKNGALIMIPLLLAGTFIPIAYGALALLAGKALIVSKLALVLASIIGIKKLVSSSAGHHESSHEVVVSGGGHGNGGWGRNMDRAYKAHTPRNA